MAGKVLAKNVNVQLYPVEVVSDDASVAVFSDGTDTVINGLDLLRGKISAAGIVVFRCDDARERTGDCL